ncbi:Putative armadillo-like helical, Rap1 GTPase-GDP dissociation stimulator 1 [Colletotrichum destructivum]|uniref:Armadillo-like helical, Rap1 GTPase-GDP dissociation stimulator 1 n=1 Tax=Colletotrichum destructivum TaxID=34406 RepID=A0AAX4ITY4_9PEZI|nr:Putative armadillo-like helical, Rap1 GTPase-GDP dissociation stimulator 1 [Colletotrichum destructivum]
MDEEAPQHQLSNGTMLTPDAIADLLSSASAWADPGSESQSRAHRTALLGDVLFTAKQLWNVGSEELDAVAEKLGDGSRDASWRRPLGESGILDFFLSIIATQGLRPELKKHMLRLIGNSCADTDENREKVVASGALAPIIGFLADDAAFLFAVPVLYNILVDYEPAQAQASAESLTLHLVDLLASTRLADAPHLVDIVVKILALLATHETEATLAPSQTPAVLLTLALAPTTDAEDFVSLTAVALAYLTHAPVQAAFIATSSVPMLLDTLYHLQTQLDALQIEDADAAVQLRALPQSFIQVLADISYADEFPLRHPLGSPVLDTLQSWLSLPNPHLRAAACLCLGNVARSDEASFALVRDSAVHLPLVALVRDATDSQLLHSALSFLKNLAIPSQNKPVLGDAGLLDPDVLPRVWALDANPQVQFSAVSLARLLLVNTPPNVRRLCAPLSPDPLSPSHETTQLHRLLDIFARSDAEHTRTEAARAAAVVCRVLHTTPIPPVLPDWDPSEDGYVFRPEKPLSPAALAEAEGDGSTKRRAKFYRQHAGLNKALAFLVTQTRFPVLRSEAWFVFALMCRAKDGADVVIRTLQVAGAFEALTEAITGRTFAAAEEARDGVRAIEEGPAGAGQAAVVSGGSNAAMVEGLGLEPQQADPSQAAGMKKVDRENGLVMVTELVKNHADELPAGRRAAFEDMLREGSEMLVDEKGKANA